MHPGTFQPIFLTTDLFKKLGVEKATGLIPDWKAVKSSVFTDFRLDDEKLKEALTFISSMDNLKSLGIAFIFRKQQLGCKRKKELKPASPFCRTICTWALILPGFGSRCIRLFPASLMLQELLCPGEPFIVAGHNEKIAWGMTNLMVDDIDLFSEKINPDNMNQYLFNGEWKDMQVKKEIITIKGRGCRYIVY